MKPQKILSKKYVRGKPYYKVKWEGIEKEEATWESPPALLKFKSLINKYEIKNWGMALDEKFFDPENYLNKGFARAKGDKREAKEIKRSQKNIEKHNERQSKKRKESEKLLLGSQPNSEDSDHPKHQQPRRRGQVIRKHPKQTDSSSQGSQSADQSIPERQRSKTIKKQKDKKNRMATQQICVIDSESNHDDSTLISNQKKGGKDSKLKKYYSGEGEILELISSENPPILDTCRQPDSSQMPLVPLSQAHQCKESANQVCAHRQTADLDKAHLLNKVDHLTPQEEASAPKSTVNNYYQLQVQSEQIPQPITPTSPIVPTQPQKQKPLNLEQSNTMNLTVQTNKSSQVILKIFHLQKLSDENRSYFIEFSDGTLIKLSTVELMEKHPNQFLAYLERAMLKKYSSTS